MILFPSTISSMLFSSSSDVAFRRGRLASVGLPPEACLATGAVLGTQTCGLVDETDETMVNHGYEKFLET